MAAINYEKIGEFEELIASKLQPKLDSLLQDRDVCLKTIEDLERLKANLEVIDREELKKMSTMVNIGGEVFVQAEIPDTSSVFVDVGMGFFPEMKIKEALEFISTKKDYLEKRADKLSEEASKVNSDIKLVMAALDEMMQLPQERQRPLRSF